MHLKTSLTRKQKCLVGHLKDLTKNILSKHFSRVSRLFYILAKPAVVYQKSKSSSSACEPYGVYYVADQSNCASYIMCDEGKETKMKCGEKQLFNTETSQCDDFQQVFCANRPVNSAERNQCMLVFFSQFFCFQKLRISFCVVDLHGISWCCLFQILILNQ